MRISIPAATHARVMALSDVERAGLALEVLDVIERRLALTAAS